MASSRRRDHSPLDQQGSSSRCQRVTPTDDGDNQPRSSTISRAARCETTRTPPPREVPDGAVQELTPDIVEQLYKLNVAVQPLFANIDFMQEICNKRRQAPKGGVCKWLITICGLRWSLLKDNDKRKFLALYNHLNHLNPGIDTMDIANLFRCIIQSVHHELSTCYLATANNIITTAIKFNVSKNFTCYRCRKTTTEQQYLSNLTLTLTDEIAASGSADMVAMISDYFRRKPSTTLCSCTNQVENGETATFVEKLPRILFVNFERVTRGMGTHSSCVSHTTPVEVLDSLNLEYWSSTNVDNCGHENDTFQLHAIVEHSGEFPHTGQFVCHVKKFDEWHAFKNWIWALTVKRSEEEKYVEAAIYCR